MSFKELFNYCYELQAGVIYLCFNSVSDHLSEGSAPNIRENFVLISGCLGGRKSTLLSELAARGYRVIQEPGRQIVEEQVAIGGDGLPWLNLKNLGSGSLSFK